MSQNLRENPQAKRRSNRLTYISELPIYLFNKYKHELRNELNSVHRRDLTKQALNLDRDPTQEEIRQHFLTSGAVSIFQGRFIVRHYGNIVTKNSQIPAPHYGFNVLEAA